MVGTEISNYRILEKLGEGGMGVVYKAVDVNLDRTVAIKALNTELTGNSELEQRFRAEAKAQANLNHTNLATLFALLIQDGRPWMVMEFIEGETFEQMIQRRGPIPSEEAIPLFRQALLGLGYAHRMGIVHRDIKPSNLMVNRQGIVKVMDFGIAKVLGARGMTRTGTQMGTAFYMSPEQVLNRGVDIRSDIYSLGVTLYEMLTANLPFTGDSDYQIMTDHVNTPPPLLTKFYPYVPKGVENAVLKAIEKQPDARFQTVEEFGAALEHPQDFGVTTAPAAARGATVVDRAATGAAVTAAASNGQIVQAASTPVPFLTRERKIIGAGLLAVLVLVGAWFGFRPNPKPSGAPPVLARSGTPAVSSGGQIGPLKDSTPVTAVKSPDATPDTTKTDPSKADPSKSGPGKSAPGKSEAPQTSPDTNRVASSLSIPAGTVVAVRLIQGIDSSRDRAGQRFEASVDSPVAARGRTVIPRGATARVALVNAAQAGHIKGRSELGLQLVALSIQGRSYPVRSSIVEKQGSSRGKVSAEVIGGGAAVGAAIGGFLGRRRGAATGAVAGAGAGTGVQMMTKGQAVILPSETRIEFTLRSAIDLTP